MPIIAALLVIFHAYVGVRLIPDLWLSPAGQLAAIVALVISWVAVVAGFLMRRARLPHSGPPLALLSLIAMGWFASLWVVTVLRDLLLLIVSLVQYAIGDTAIRGPIAHWSAVAVIVLATLFSVVGYFNARRRARVVEVEVAISGLPVGLEGFRIAQISDIHVGPTIRKPYIEAIANAVNGLHADLIAITGDLVDGSVTELRDHTAPLAALSARHGSYFVTGNHEYYSGAADWIREVRRLGVRVLLNEHVVVEHGGSSLVLAGVTDFTAHQFDESQRSDPVAALRGAPAAAAVRVLLAHQPRSADAAERAGFELQLSGHTHGGQFFPFNLLVGLQQPFTAGLHRLGRMWVYTSRGTGYWGPPKRMFAPSEITLLRLVAAQ